MSHAIEWLGRTVLVGVGATLVMDLWSWALRRLGVSTLDMAMLGRWVGHLVHGHWRHVAITRATPVRGERAIGWLVHYAIGVSFAAVLVLGAGPDWLAAPTIVPSLGVGVVTVIGPWFILQPGMGAGIASSRTARPLLNATRSLASHVVFGLGLYLAASWMAR